MHLRVHHRRENSGQNFGARMPRRAPKESTPYRSPATSRPQAESFPRVATRGAARHEGPALLGPAGGAPAARRLRRRLQECLSPQPHPMVRPHKGESQAPVILCGPLRRHASDFLPRTPRGATHGRLGRLSRIPKSHVLPSSSQCLKCYYLSLSHLTRGVLLVLPPLAPFTLDVFLIHQPH